MTECAHWPQVECFTSNLGGFSSAAPAMGSIPSNSPPGAVGPNRVAVFAGDNGENQWEPIESDRLKAP